eukprot:SAG11_NODE_15241_length_584_cov_0.931959_1_plen_58_part_10
MEEPQHADGLGLVPHLRALLPALRRDAKLCAAGTHAVGDTQRSRARLCWGHLRQGQFE